MHKQKCIEILFRWVVVPYGSCNVCGGYVCAEWHAWRSFSQGMCVGALVESSMMVNIVTFIQYKHCAV